MCNWEGEAAMKMERFGGSCYRLASSPTLAPKKICPFLAQHSHWECCAKKGQQSYLIAPRCHPSRFRCELAPGFCRLPTPWPLRPHAATLFPILTPQDDPKITLGTQKAEKRAAFSKKWGLALRPPPWSRGLTKKLAFLQDARGVVRRLQAPSRAFNRNSATSFAFRVCAADLRIAR